MDFRSGLYLRQVLIRPGVLCAWFLLFLLVLPVSFALSPLSDAFYKCNSVAINFIKQNANCHDKGFYLDYPTHTLGRVTLDNGVTTYASYSYLLACKPPTYEYASSSTNHYCVTGVTCPDGSAAASLAQCPTSSVTCSEGLYNNNGTCTLIPDCNASTDTGGNYWDVNTNTCQTASGIVSCITGSSTVLKYCPPISECKESGYICKNDPNEIATQKVISDTARAAAQLKADTAKASTADSLTKAQSPLVAAQLDKQAAADRVNALKSQLDSLTADPHSSWTEKQDLAQHYGEALNQLSTAAKTLQDIENSTGLIQGNNDYAHQQAGQVPTSPTSTEAGQHADNASQAASDALKNLQDAIAGLGQGVGSSLMGGVDDLFNKLDEAGAGLGHYRGNGNGFGSGSGSGTGQDTDGDGECDVDCPEDTDGDGECDINCASGQGEHGDFSDTIDAANQELQDANDQLNTLLADIHSSMQGILGNVSGGAAQLPVIDLGTMKGVPVRADLNDYAPQLSIISTLILALAWLIAFSIIMSKG